MKRGMAGLLSTLTILLGCKKWDEIFTLWLVIYPWNSRSLKEILFRIVTNTLNLSKTKCIIGAKNIHKCSQISEIAAAMFFGSLHRKGDKFFHRWWNVDLVCLCWVKIMIYILAKFQFAQIEKIKAQCQITIITNIFWDHKCVFGWFHRVGTIITSQVYCQAVHHTIQINKRKQ